MNVTLTVTAGPHADRVFTFDRHDTFLVGRSEHAHFQLSHYDPHFSLRHFLVELNPPRARVYDLNSRNGVAVNGHKVRTADLKDGDELRAGHTVIRVGMPRAAWASGRPALVPPASAGSPAGPSVPGYALIEEIGRGGVGAVYRAIRQADMRTVALKVVALAPGASRGYVRQFLHEAAILAQLGHPHVVRCLDSGECEGGLYLAMELANGPDMRQWVRDRGPMDVPTAVRLTLHVLDGLAHAHARGYVHGDVRPGNVLLDGPKKKRVAKLADFGLAWAFGASNLSGPAMQGETGGSLAFSPPERVTHYRDAKPPADQYSAAATLYYLLTGRYVLDLKSDATDQLVQIVTANRLPVRWRREDVPPGLEDAIQKALSREVEDRYLNAIAFGNAIRPFA